ncbi:caspase recruitment domain-containing protein 19 isoform X2 [Eubalaena glacialis]|nr:caspase recruitment domain-containing protein 19 isoform X2 [Eubalaena glacialis]
MPFLTGLGRLSEQQVDRIILQLNRYYPQILSNKDAEKVPRNLRLLSHPFLSGLGEAGGRTAWSSGTPRYLCEYVSATSWATCSGAVSGTARSSTGPCTSMPSPCTAACPAGTPCVRLHLCLGGFSIPSRVPFLASCWTDPLRVLTGDVPAQLTPAQGVSLSLEASGPLPALLGSGSCSRAFLPRTRGLPDLSRPGRRAGTPRLLLPPRWVLPGQASAQSSPDHGAEPCRMDGGLHLRPPTCGPAWQPCGSFPAMLTLSRSCVGSQWQAGPLGMGTPHHSGVGLAMP